MFIKTCQLHICAFHVLHNPNMSPIRSTKERGLKTLIEVAEAHYVAKRIMVISSSFCLPYSLECVSTHTAGWSAVLNVTPIETFALNEIHSTMNITFVGLSRDNDLQYIWKT